MRYPASIIPSCCRFALVRPARCRAVVWLALLGLVRPAAGQSTQSVSTQPGSGIAIQVTNLYNGVPVRGFLPIRVNITNSSNSDGQWDVETQAAYGNGNDRHFGAKASCVVPAQGTRMIEVLAPLPESAATEPPRVLVHVYGPGVANSEISFTSNVQQVPRSALQVSVPLTTTAAYSGRGITSVASRGGVSTSIATDPSGNSTRTTVTTHLDGSATTEVVVTRPDGSTQTSTTETDPAGRILMHGLGRTTPPTRPAPTASLPTIKRNDDGSITQTTIVPQADGTMRTEIKTTQANGSVSTAYTITNAAGTVIEKGGVAPPAPPPPAIPPPAPSSVPQPGASMPAIVPAVGRVSSGNDTLFATSDSPAPVTFSTGQTKVTFSTDPLTGVTVRTTVAKNADGTTTTVTSTPSKLGTDIVTVITDASGAPKSTSHEWSLSPAAMEQAVPSGGASVHGVTPLIGSGVGDEKALLASVAAAVQPSSISIPTTAPMVFAQASPTTAAANATATRPPPPPPPPPPPTVPVTTTPFAPTSPGVRSPSGAFTTGTTTVYRGSRGALYRTYNRTPGPAIFIGLSSSLAHDQGEKIKNYYLTACVRPIQQSTLDPNAMSADWRAYLGFDLIFFTSADWLAAPPEARLALTQWTAAGGELRLISKQDGGLNLPPRISEHYGAGAIEVFSDDEFADYNFSTEHTDPKERALFSLAYHPPAGLDANAQDLGYAVPPGMQAREFALGADTLLRAIGLDPSTGATAWTSSYTGGSAPTLITTAEGMFVDLFSRNGMSFNGGAAVHFNAANRHLTVVHTSYNLDQIAQILSRYGEITVVPRSAEGSSPTAASAPAPEGAANADAVKAKAEPPTFAGRMPHLSNRYRLVAGVIVCFGLLVGPLNLFWFCRGARRPHLLWMTPLLAVVASVAILGFILLAEGIGGRGLYYRVTQLNPDGKFAVESEIESSVTGVLMHRDFDLGELAWILDFNQAEPGSPTWLEGRFVQAGKHYSGDWFASRREQMLFARAVVPSRASLRAEVVAGKPPVLHSEYNGLMVNLFYEDADGHYWKIDRMTDGQPTHLQPATEEEFTAAWNENINSSPSQLTDYLRKVAPMPGTFFALGNGEASPLEPEFPGLHWNRFRHLITGPVL